MAAPFIRQDVGPRPRQIRERRGLTRKALSESTGLTVQAIANIEVGRRKPAFETLVALAKALEVSLDALAGLSSTKYPDSVLSDVGVMSVAEKLAQFPLKHQAEVSDFVDFLWEKRVKNGKRKT